ncbi:TIGR00730 family Rossman fold protein, partial [Candidatus Parcubacteria bacterium]
RKRRFRDADAFAVLGGGAGTRDELWEELTGIQIGDHQKPVVLVNRLGCFNYVIADIEDMRRRKFIREGLEFNGLFAVVSDVHEVVPKLRHLLGETNVIALRSAG